jgi:hypothetical protein
MLKYGPSSVLESSDMSNLLQVIAGIAFVFFLPGYTMVNMMFPRKGELDPEYDQVYRATLGMGLSIVISIVVGFGLNALSTEGKGLVTSGPLWIVLLSLTALFVFVGWFRGAYPGAGSLHPSLYRAPSIPGMPRSKGNDFLKRKRTERLIMSREALMSDLRRYSEGSSTSNPQRKQYYRKRMEYTRQAIDRINDELHDLSGGR